MFFNLYGHMIFMNLQVGIVHCIVWKPNGVVSEKIFQLKTSSGKLIYMYRCWQIRVLVLCIKHIKISIALNMMNKKTLLLPK
jgi:hypothetical protein